MIPLLLAATITLTPIEGVNGLGELPLNKLGESSVLAQVRSLLHSRFGTRCRVNES